VPNLKSYIMADLAAPIRRKDRIPSKKLLKIKSTEKKQNYF
jgi:hypothetical protein